MEYPCAPAYLWRRKIPRIGFDAISETLLPLVGRVASDNQGGESNCSGSTHNDGTEHAGGPTRPHCQLTWPARVRCRVEAGVAPGAPTDPYVKYSLIRFVSTRRKASDPGRSQPGLVSARPVILLQKTLFVSPCFGFHKARSAHRHQAVDSSSGASHDNLDKRESGPSEDRWCIRM